ncbi:hypothetical protein ESB13_09835 [Filimonas effusa]|uniref:DUF2071 domain-containing protein n=2 Tax=Filimonas effusa TaxID=2508721 RepID=A0A4Q1DEQ1_9BACT|nr:hypothetical protein ESB13_09835 [Filimonas effusa]
MLLPVMHGYIDRRILVNFTTEPEIVSHLLPSIFRPKLYKDRAIVGICLIRFKHLKPKGFPDFLGISSENGAHRIAVEWEEGGMTKQGVYIPRRDTAQRFNAIAGGRLFPGKHYLAKFNVAEGSGNYHIDFTSSDNTSISIDCQTTNNFPVNSIFGTLENASAFFETGSIGYSPNGEKHEGLELQTYKWQVKSLEVSKVHSSFYENETIFPKGSIQFDNALLMTHIEHEWKQVKDKAV